MRLQISCECALMYERLYMHASCSFVLVQCSGHPVLVGMQLSRACAMYSAGARWSRHSSIQIWYLLPVFQR